ncbi:MAG: hypothetical protein QOD04_6093 [Pseudonocardiales bacterium]|nr:hypothetical protein [Pseudonocardiales bacterium]
MTRDSETRARIEEHWKASELGDIDTEHAIYAADAILDYPQSGERFRGRSKIQAQRGGHPAERHFTIGLISADEPGERVERAQGLALGLGRTAR